MAHSDKTIVFPSRIIDEEERNKRHEAIADFAKNLPEYLKQLAAEGLPTDLKAVNEFADMDEAAYTAHVKQLFKNYLSRIGFCPTAERKRIADNFNQMLENTAPAVAWLHDFKTSGYGFKEDEQGNVTADTKQAYKEADAQTETPIDTAKLMEYREQWVHVAQAWQQLNKWERKHGLNESDPNGKVYYVGYDYGQKFPGEVPATFMFAKMEQENYNAIFLNAFGHSFAK